MYTYRQIFKQAWQVVWHHPGLWLFGFFLALMGGSGDIGFLLSSYGFNSESSTGAFIGGLSAAGLFTWNGLNGLIKVIFQSPLYFIGVTFILLIVLALSLLVVWLIIVAQSAAISQTIVASKKRPALVSQGFAAGITNFWPVIGLNAILRAAVWLLFAGLSLLAAAKFANARVLYILVFDVAWIVVLIFSFLIKYAICGVVLKQWSFIDSLKNGWGLFKANWLMSLEVAILLFILYAGLNMLLFFFLGLGLLYALKLYAGFRVGIFLILIIFAALFVVIESVLALFQWSTWAIIFELISSPKFKVATLLRQGGKGLWAIGG